MLNSLLKLRRLGMSKRSKKLDEKVLELLAGGALITEVCRELGVSTSTLSKWRRSDREFDEACWSAEAQGIMVQRSTLIEDMREAIDTPGPGSATRIQGIHNLLHENGRTAGKLVSRMNDRVRVDASVSHQMIIGWQEASGELIDLVPIPSTPANGRQYVDVPRRATTSILDKSEADIG
jgi:hypothetical protein